MSVARVKNHTGQEDVAAARAEYAQGRGADRYDYNWRSTNSLFQVDTRPQGDAETYQLSLAIGQQVDISGTSAAVIVLPTLEGSAKEGCSISLRVRGGAETFTWDAGTGLIYYPNATAPDLTEGLYVLYTDDNGERWFINQVGVAYGEVV